MQSDIHLQKQNTVLVVDVKYYSFIIQMYFAKHTLHVNNIYIYWIFTYVKNRDYEFDDERNRALGMLLYAKTEEEIHSDNVYQMQEN